MLRKQIVAGQFAPGQRLPTFQEIESSFSVSRSVSQAAIERLKKDGFVDPSTRQGLYVAPNPPHLRRYGIAFPVIHGDPAWSRFDEVFVRESRLLQQAGSNHEFDVFAGTADHRESAKAMGRMRREVLSDRLAGLILTPGTFELANQAPFSATELPKVFVYQRASEKGPIVSGDGESVIDRSLHYLAQQGCRRVAVIRVEGAYSTINPAHFEKQGLVCRPQWLQAIGRGDTTVLSTLIPLLMDYPPDQRPDGLFVLEDNLLGHVASAVVSMGMRIGHDLQIVAHANWPLRTPSVFPIRRIGFHVGHMLARCIDAIDMQRRGEAPPDVQRVPAMFEDEIDPT